MHIYIHIYLYVRGYKCIFIFVDIYILIYADESSGRTALHYASYCGNTAMIKLLLEKGADAEAKDMVSPLCTNIYSTLIFVIFYMNLINAHIYPYLFVFTWIKIYIYICGYIHTHICR
jgi:hypothetical protein